MAQISDYDVDAPPPSTHYDPAAPPPPPRSPPSPSTAPTTSASTVPSSHRLGRPVASSSDLGQRSTDIDRDSSTDHVNPSPYHDPGFDVRGPVNDPDSFYRRYRDSFRAREPSGIYVLRTSPQSDAASPSSESMASVLPPRPSHFDNKLGGPQPASVSVRVNSLAGKTVQDARESRKESASILARGRQASVKAFVNQFEQRPDEVISMPGSKPASRSASAHNSPRNDFRMSQFRSRTPSRARAAGDDKYGRGRRQSIVEDVPEPPPLNIQKRSALKVSTGQSQLEPRPPGGGVGGGPTSRVSEQSGQSISASQSLTDLMSPLNSGMMNSIPLFGEVVAGQSNYGWGISDTTPSPSGPEGKLYRPNTLFRDDTQLEMSPISPTSWYKLPTFEGFDASRVPAVPTTLSPPVQEHKRGNSDLSGLNYTISPITPNTAPVPQDIQQQQVPPPGHTSTEIPSSVPSDQVRHGSDSKAGANTASFAQHAAREGTGPSSISNPTSQPHSQRHTLSINTHSLPKMGAQVGEYSQSAKSPPLRNSRTRPPLSAASPAASRTSGVERSKTVGSGSSPTRRQARKTLPELGTVDFAARRERIQRAFSKSVEEKEAEQRRSLILEAQRRKHEKDEIPPVPVVPPIDARYLDGQETQLQSGQDPSSGLAKVPSVAPVKKAAAPEGLEDLVPPAPFFSHDTTAGDDSPTLGAGSRFHQALTASQTPSDAGSADSAVNYFDPQLQKRALPSSTAAVPSAELSPRPHPESVHIVLSEGQIAKSHTKPGSEPNHESRWSMSSWNSSNDSNYRYSGTGVSDARLESIDETHDGQEPYRSDERQHKQNTVEVQVSVGRQPSSHTTAKADGASQGADTHESTSASWMVDHSKIPPRSFAQDTSSSRAASWASFATPRRSHVPEVTTPAGSRPQHESVARARESEGISNSTLLSPAFGSDHSSAKYAGRASLINLADFDAASPSIGDWIAVQAQDTPTEERSPYSFSDTITTTPPNHDQSRPRTPKKSDGPVLPEIEPSDGGLGIDINVQTPRDKAKTNINHNISDTRVEPGHLSAQNSTLRATSAPPSRLSLKSEARKASPPVDTEKLSLGPRAANSQSTLSSDEPKSASAETRTLASEHNVPPPPPPKPLTDEEQKTRDAEQKRLNRRKNIIKELIDTESSFGQDMTVVVDIYKETSHVILQNADDVKILFGNATEVVHFSTGFLDSLKAAVAPVYKLPRSKRWRTKRDSTATAESSLGDETSSIVNLELTDDERDRMTSIGTAFTLNLEQMEKVYTDYLKNHEAANQRLAELMKSDKVQIWLNECRAYAHDLTTAWSLDSLLVKPVQRILKYPLLLKELADVTPENHPDFVALDSMTREIVGVSKRINAAKKRADLVEQAHSNVPTKKDKRKKDDRSTIAKAFGRNREKFKQQVGFGDITQDRAYNILADKFGSHFFQVQVVMRDVEMYTVDVQASVKKFENFIAAMEEHMDVAQSPYPEIESKWRIFRQQARELQLTALSDHVKNVKEHVIEPMKILLKYYDGPQRMMEKRKKRLLDHARWKQVQDAGGKVDKKMIEQGEQFLAINETLKEELPQLFIKTKQLVEHCLNIFVQLQLQWQTVWRRKLSQAVDARYMPKNAKDIVDAFNGDFKYTEAQVLSLAICNGSFKDDDAFGLGQNTMNPSMSSLTLNGDDGSSQHTSSTLTDLQDSRYVNPGRGRATSSHSQTYPTPTYYPAAYAQGPPHSSRDRTSSSASAHRHENGQWGNHNNNVGYSSSPQPHSMTPNQRPSSQSARGNSNSSKYQSYPYDPASYPRYSDDGPYPSMRHSHMSQPRNATGRPTDSQYGLGSALAGAAGAAGATANPRTSAVFNSALPPSETGPSQSASHSYHSHSRLDPNYDHERYSYREKPKFNVLFLAASVYEFNIDRARREAGYPYLTYAAGEIFDVIGEKGELWLAKNQDDTTNTLGWIWNKHFAKLAGDR